MNQLVEVHMLGMVCHFKSEDAAWKHIHSLFPFGSKWVVYEESYEYGHMKLLVVIDQQSPLYLNQS